MHRANKILIPTEQHKGRTILLAHTSLHIHYTDLIKVFYITESKVRLLHYFQEHAAKQQFTHVTN